ncbi:HAD family hydrolase [Myceligenerans xiligouense]|uniref:HAD family hydrolase n=1 Tax=Myceligenerans xiligouense TaxID=253184 RepID=UPI000F4DA6EA|nr:HAD family hydrolase [Myceligenerans xiligouense]
MSARTLVLDFDGTVCVGDGPVLLYAEEVARRTGLDIRDGVAHFLRTGRLPRDDTPTPATTHAPEDGYQAVVALAYAAARRGGSPLLDGTLLHAAYLASRARFADDGAGTSPPEGLHAFLDRMRASRTRVVLVTNSPLTGVADWLERHGTGSLVDDVVPDAGKPAAMSAILRALLSGTGAVPDTLVSVGDVHANDIAPALAIGACGAHIDRWASRPGRATWSAPAFDGLFEPLVAWSSGEKMSIESVL